MLIAYSLRKVLEATDGTTVPMKVLTLDSTLENKADPSAGVIQTKV